MAIVNKNSLLQTLDNVNEHLLYEKKFSASERNEILNYITSRHALPRSYRGMFAPTDLDYRVPEKLFTGEALLVTRAAKSHIMSEECCRILRLLNGNKKRSLDALNKSIKNLEDAVEYSISRGSDVTGTYCCGKCTAAYWRNLSSDLEKNRSILKEGMKYLKTMRDGKGRWKKFPFYYTLYSLITIELPEAVDELRYSSHILEKISKRNSGNDKYSKRRKLIVEKALKLINN